MLALGQFLTTHELVQVIQICTRHGLLLTSASESSTSASYMAVRLGDAVWPCS